MKRCFLLAIVFCLGFLLVSMARAAIIGNVNADTWAAHRTQPPTGPIARHYEPLVISAADMQPLLGKPFSNLRFYSFQNNKWTMITSQFDDRLPDNHMVFSSGPWANPKDANFILDPKDEIMCMVRDAGEQAGRDKWPASAQEGVEIKIVDPITEREAFVYVFYFPKDPPRESFPQLLVADDSGQQYVGGSNLWQVAGITNRHRGKEYKTIVNESVVIPETAGGSGKNFLDRMKYRVEVRFLAGMLKLKFNENNVIGEVSQIQPGPLRLSVRNWASIILPGRFKSPKIWAEMGLFETFVVMPIKIRVPVNPGVIITDFRMSMGYDLNNLAKGMKFYNSNNLEGFTVDGVPTPEEKNMNTDIDEWRCVTGPQGSILTFSVWDQGYRDQSKINVYFIDDVNKQIPPENIPGQMGYFLNESTISSLKPRDYVLIFYICFPPHFHDPNILRKDIIAEYVNMNAHPVYVLINGKKQVNRIANPEPLWPRFD